MKSLIERFEEKTCYTGDCIIWTACVNNRGYPQFYVHGKGFQLAHRVAYQLYCGHLDNHMQLDHLCRNPRCVNIGHLEPVTQSVNMKRAYKAAPREKPTHCKNGHSFQDQNVIHHHGSRQCRICYNEWQRNYRKSKA